MTYLNNFTDKLNIAVIGATGGIGKAICELLINDTAINQLYALSRSEANLQAPKVTCLKLDFNDEETIKLAAQKIDKRLDIVINATGLLHNDTLQPEKSLSQLDSGNFLHNFIVNSIGPALVAKHFLPLMHNDRKTLFAALSARVGSISDNRLGGWYAYRASKAALNMIIKNLSIETSRKNKQAIIVGLHPGTVNTDLSRPFQANVPKDKLFSAHYAAECLLTVINQLQVTDSGKCFAWDNKEILA